jgi:hypothetical protein
VHPGNCTHNYNIIKIYGSHILLGGFNSIQRLSFYGSSGFNITHPFGPSAPRASNTSSSVRNPGGPLFSFQNQKTKAKPLSPVRLRFESIYPLFYLLFFPTPALPQLGDTGATRRHLATVNRHLRPPPRPARLPAMVAAGQLCRSRTALLLPPSALSLSPET